MNDKKKENNMYILFLMILLSFIAQIISLVKGATIASKFGATNEMDAFNFTQSISNFIFSFVSTGITTVLIPAYIAKTSKKTIDSFITVIYGGALGLIIIISLFQKSIIHFFSHGSVVFYEVAVSVLLLNLITNFLSSLTGVTNAFLQCKERFILPKILNVFSTLVTVLMVLNISDINIYIYSIILLISTAISSVIQIFCAMKEGFRYSPALKMKDKGLKKLVIVFLPTVFSTGLYQISLLTDSLVSSKLGEGQLSILNYSNNIVSMVNVLIITNLITYIYPKIANDILINDIVESQKKFFDYITIFFSIICLIVVVFLSVGKEGIMLLYERGKFTSNLTDKVYLCTCLYMLGMPINVSRDLIYRYFYAHGDTKSTLKNSMVISILNIVISLLLSKIIGVYGIIFGTVITSILSLCMIMIRFIKKFGFYADKYAIFKETLKIAVICVVSAGIVFQVKSKWNLTNAYVGVVAYGGLSVIAYLLLSIIFKSKVFRIRL